MKNEIIKFVDGEIQLDVPVSPNEDTVWLSTKDMTKLFGKDVNTVNEHISSIFDEGELDKETSTGISGKSTGGRPPKIYNLDVIISVGYRVKSKKGIIFRKWATEILKNYMIQGHAINEKRMKALNRTIQLQSNIIAGIAGIDADTVLKVVEEYSVALELLNDYDHQSIKKPEGTKCKNQLTYAECKNVINHMNYGSDVFGVEKEKGKLEGILAAVYQEVFGREVYPSLEEKAANLLYFLVKDHPFADGCKRISATLFLEFLSKNKALYRDNKKILSNSALVAITLMVAESKPEEKNIMIYLIMNFLK